MLVNKVIVNSLFILITTDLQFSANSELQLVIHT